MNDSTSKLNGDNKTEESTSTENKCSLAEALENDQIFENPMLAFDVFYVFYSGDKEWTNAYLNVSKHKKENITMHDVVLELKKQGYEKTRQVAAEDLELLKKHLKDDAILYAEEELEFEISKLEPLMEENRRLRAELAQFINEK